MATNLDKTIKPTETKHDFGTEIKKETTKAADLLESPSLQDELDVKYNEVKYTYPLINEEVKKAEENNLQDNAPLFKKVAVDHNTEMNNKYGKGGNTSEERKQEERWFDSFASKVCEFVNKHPKMVKAVKIGSTVTAAVCGAATMAFPPAAIGAVTFGAVAGAIEVIEKAAEKRKMKEMEKKVAELAKQPDGNNKGEADELEKLKSQIKQQEEKIGQQDQKLENLEKKLNTGIPSNPSVCAHDIKIEVLQKESSYVAKQEITNMPNVIQNAMKGANNEVIKQHPNSHFAAQAADQNSRMTPVHIQ